MRNKFEEVRINNRRYLKDADSFYMCTHSRTEYTCVVEDCRARKFEEFDHVKNKLRITGTGIHYHKFSEACEVVG